MLQSPLECPNNILKTSRWPWFRPKVGKRIEWVRLFGSRRNLSLVMIGLVWKVVGPKCLHGFLTNGWKRWLATQPGRLHPLIFSLTYFTALLTCWWEFSLSIITSTTPSFANRGIIYCPVLAEGLPQLSAFLERPKIPITSDWWFGHIYVCMIDPFIWIFGIISILLILDTVLMIFWNCLERKWFWGRLGVGNSNFSEVGSFGL